MASEIKLPTAIRDDMLDLIVAAIGSGGKLKIYDGDKPAGPATAVTDQNLLAELALASTPGVVSAGVLTFNAITQDNSADATGAASWYRVSTSADAGVIDGTVGTSDADLIMNTTAIVAGGPVAVTAFTYTAPGG